MNPPPGKQNWRQGSTPGHGEPASWRKAKRAQPAGSEQHWKKATERTVSPAAVKRLKLLVYLAALATMLTVFVAWMLYRPRPVPLIAMAVIDYPAPFDPNAFAVEDLRRFEGVFQQYRNVSFSQQLEGRDGSWKTLLDRQLEKFHSGGPGNGRLFPDNDVLILYLSAHGAVDRQGRPTLLMSGSGPLDDTTWVPVLDLVAHINQHANVQRCRKVLILDAGRIRENWSAGILYNGFAEVLQKALADARIPRLYILNSTRGPQRGYAAPELGGSAFAYFVAAGLRGAADTDADGQVRLLELADYLRNHVASWVSRYRTGQQQPILIPADAEDFGLAYVTRYEQPAISLVEPDSRDRDAIEELWQRFSQLERGGLHRRLPVECAELQSSLARMESLFLAGQGYQEQLQSTLASVKRALSEADSDPVLQRTDLGSASLALARRLGRLTPAEQDTAAESFAKWQQARAAPAGSPEKVPPPVEYAAATAAVWHALLQQPTDVRHLLAEGLEFAGTSRQPAVPAAKEMALLTMLRDHLDWDVAGPSVGRAILVQDTAEREAAPEDVRAQYWISPLVDTAEQQVRLARDELFVGDPAALAAAEQRWSAAVGSGTGGAYAEIERVSQSISAAYATRDAACANVPYLAQWLLSDPALADRASLVNTLLDVVRKNRGLSANLDRQVQGGQASADAAAIAEQAQEIADGLGDLLGRYQQISGELSIAKAGNVRATLGRIMTALEVPLVTDQRADLRSKLLANLFVAVEAQDHGASAPAESGTDDTPFLQWLTDLPTHPALALLDRSGLAPGDERITAVRVFAPLGGDTQTPEQERQARLARLAEMGGEMRDRLADIDELRGQLAAGTEHALATGNDEPPAQVRQGLSKADFLVRCAAGLLGRRPWLSAAEDPSVRLRQLDLNFLLLWHGQRVLNDFWGPLKAGGSDWFVDAARQHLEAARILCREARGYQVRFGNAVAEREAAAAHWAPVAAEDVDMIEGQQLVRHQVEWRPDPAMPDGLAAVFLRWTNGGLVPLVDATTQSPLRRRAAQVDGQAETRLLQHLIPNNGAEELSGLMEAVAFYRGHERSTGFFVGKGSPGATVAFEKPKAAPPRIRVRGDSTQKTQIIFILDCSGSMREEMAVENQQKLTRLQIARSRLLEVLDALDEDHYYVGLVLYGHRAGWKATGSGRYEMTWRSAADRQRKLHPAEDVELAVPVRPLKFTDVGGEVRDLRHVIAAKLSDLRPYGETPLYYALTEALQSFDRELPGPRHVVVITDGVNEQTSEGARIDAIKHRDDVQQALKNPKTRAQIDIIGFGLKSRFSSPAEEQTWQRGQADLKAIARDPLSQGEFHEARDPSTLLQKLRDSLRLVKFYVQVADGPPPDPSAFLDLNQTWTVQHLVPGAAYAVRLAGYESEVAERVQLEGGESLLLQFNRATNRLEHLRFEDELRVSKTDIRDPQQLERRFFVGAHLPQRQGRDEVWFRLSVQNAMASQFSPRPHQIWAEIRPLPTRDRVFYVSDAEFEDDRPVPVLRLRVAPWPLEAQQAEVRLWFTLSDESQARSFEVELDKPVPIDVTGATLQVEPRPGNDGEPYQIVVIEQHPTGSALFPMCLQMRPVPDHVWHSYFEDAAKVRHQFAYDDRSFWKQAKPRLLVTPIRQEGVLENWVSTGPLEVDLTRR